MSTNENNNASVDAKKLKRMLFRIYGIERENTKTEKKTEKKFHKTQVIELNPQPLITIKFDPLAVMGTIVAMVMIVCVMIGCVQVNRVNEQIAQTEVLLSGLKAEYSILQNEYEHGYDIEEIRTAALAMGMIPRDQAEHVTVNVSLPEEIPELTWWENLVHDIQELFA